MEGLIPSTGFEGSFSGGWEHRRRRGSRIVGFYKGESLKQRIAKYGLLLFPALMILSAYCNTFSSPPYLDDFHSFIYQQQVYIHDFSPSSLISVSGTDFGWKRWLPMVTFAMNHKLWGGQLIFFHLTNIAIHVLTFLSVFLLASHLLRPSEPWTGQVGGRSSSFWLGLCAASLWALNPVQTSAVTYLVQRMASMQALFYVTSVGLYLKGRLVRQAHGPAGASLAAYLGSLLAAVCAFLSKENAATLPLMILITEIWFFQPDLPLRLRHRLLKTRWPARVVLALCAAGFVYLGSFAIHEFSKGYGVRHFTMDERLLTEARIVVWYMSLLIWPAPSRLSMEHDVTLSTSFFSPPSTAAAILFLIVLLWGAIHFRRKSPVITYGLVWFFANLAIESTFIPLELIFEHRLYLPSAGLFISLVAAVDLFFRRSFAKMPGRDRLVVMCSLFMIVSSAFTMATFYRNQAWENILTIHQEAAEKAPNSPRAHSNLANAYFQTEQYDKAIESAEKSLSLSRHGYESNAVSINAILMSLIRQGDLDAATERTEDLLRQCPKDSDADSMPFLFTNLAEAYRRKGMLENAYAATMRALFFVQRTDNSRFKRDKIASALGYVLADAKAAGVDLNGDGKPDPGDMSPETWIATEFYRQNDVEIAKQLLAEALAAHPGDAESLSLSNQIRETEEANREQQTRWSFTAKYVRHPFSEFNFCMAIAFIVQEKQMPVTIMKVGEKFLDHAVGLRPDSTDAHLLSGWYHYQQNDAEGAVAEAGRAIELDPSNGKAWLGLGFFQMKAERREEAAASFDRAMQLYPGYSQRRVVSDLIADLKQGPQAEEPGTTETRTQDKAPGPAAKSSTPSSS